RLLETYNSLTDKHLVGYFSNARIRRHLQKSGLISRSGRIIPEREYRLNAMRKEHQRHAQERLADAIFRKVLDMEVQPWDLLSPQGLSQQLNGPSLKGRPEADITVLGLSASETTILFFQMNEIKESLEEIYHVHCPHPPLAPRNHHRFCPLVTAEEPCCSQ
ncbi:ERIC3 protein, partial [Oenanthe oenanthe]|nr:ERIC3 protein [Oenanthe oenanthe]